MTGVLLTPVRRVPADLVVDAAGRGTRLPVWLEQWGFGRPPEDTVDVGIDYATHQVRIPDGLIAEKVVVAGASRDQPRGLGMLCYEDGTWSLTTFGVAKVEPPHDFAGMCALADELLPPHIAAAIRQGEPIGEVAFHKYPASRWRRYDKLRALPAGHHSVRRRRRQLQSDVRAGHDDDLAAGGPSAAGAGVAGAPTWPASFNRATAKTT